MGLFSNYNIATNKAYEILSLQDCISLPIDIFSIVNSLPNIRLKKYSDICKRFSISMDEFIDIAESEYGSILKKGNKSEIIYNDYKDITTNRFTVAHELGHVILNHKAKDANEEKEANCFARNILCPIPIVKSLELKTLVDYMTVFDVSAPMANASFNNQKSDDYYIGGNLYNAVDELFYAYMTGTSINKLYGITAINF